MDYTEETGYVPAKDEFFIYSTETQFLFCMSQALFSLDASGAPEAGRLADGGEGAGNAGVVQDDTPDDNRQPAPDLP